jgi:hypothetical protein
MKRFALAVKEKVCKLTENSVTTNKNTEFVRCSEKETKKFKECNGEKERFLTWFKQRVQARNHIIEE